MLTSDFNFPLSESLKVSGKSVQYLYIYIYVCVLCMHRMGGSGGSLRA